MGTILSSAPVSTRVGCVMALTRSVTSNRLQARKSECNTLGRVSAIRFAASSTSLGEVSAANEYRVANSTALWKVVGLAVLSSSSGDTCRRAPAPIRPNPNTCSE